MARKNRKPDILMLNAMFLVLWGVNILAHSLDWGELGHWVAVSFIAGASLPTISLLHETRDKTLRERCSEISNWRAGDNE